MGPIISSKRIPTSLSYAYTGNRRNAYSYDFNGNVTSDATNSLQSSYNLINLPAQIKSGSTVKANYSYLSDGTKTKALNASSVGYDYAGSFTYSHASNGSKTLESVAFGIAYSDFGARLYDRSAAWTTIDPMAEKYYAVSSYVFCHSNPVNRIDPDGMTDWKRIRQGAYSVVGGTALAIGGVAMAGASAGVLSGFSAFLISDSIVAIGSGLALMTIGIVDDYQLSENAQDLPMNIPEMGGVSIDSLTDNDNHLWKHIGTGVDFVIGFGTSARTEFSPIIPSFLGVVAPVASAVESVVSMDNHEDISTEAESENMHFDYNSNYLWNPKHQPLSF